jgi:hypothetical protein
MDGTTLLQNIYHLIAEGLSIIGCRRNREILRNQSFLMGFKVSLFHFSAAVQIDRQRVRIHVGRRVKVHSSARSGRCVRALDSRATVNAMAPHKSQDLPTADRHRCAYSILWANPQFCAGVLTSGVMTRTLQTVAQAFNYFPDTTAAKRSLFD